MAKKKKARKAKKAAPPAPVARTRTAPKAGPVELSRHERAAIVACLEHCRDSRNTLAGAPASSDRIESALRTLRQAGW